MDDRCSNGRTTWEKLSLLVLICQLLADVALCMNVTFRAPRYVLFGDRAQLWCEYDVAYDALHKVEWLKNNKKIFQFVKGRNPPYMTHPQNLDSGARLDDIESDERHVVLKDVNFSASGLYSCAVSIESPIFTKSSNEAEVSIMQGQTEGPYITMPKPEYSVGDQLDMNCTSSYAVPDPEITWLLNGKQVERNFVRTFPLDKKGIPGAVKLSLPLTSVHVPKIMLTCISTIPAYLGPGASRLDYADYRANSVAIAVKPPAEPLTSSSVADGNSSLRMRPDIAMLVMGFVTLRLSLFVQYFSLDTNLFNSVRLKAGTS